MSRSFEVALCAVAARAAKPTRVEKSARKACSRGEDDGRQIAERSGQAWCDT